MAGSKLPKDGLVLFQNYCAGHAQDLSGNGNHGTLTNSGGFGGGGKLRYRPAASNGHILVADSPELQVTAGTFAFAGKFKEFSIFADKRDGGGLNFLIYINPPSEIRFVTSDGNMFFAIPAYSYEGIGSLVIIKSEGSSKAKLFFAGVHVADSALAKEMTTNDAPLIIGNSYVGGSPMPSSLHAVAIYNRAVDATTEIPAIHNALANLITPHMPKRNIGTGLGSLDPNTDAVSAWNMETIKGKVIDAKGLNDGTVVAPAINAETPWGEPTLDFQGGYVDCGTALDLQNPNSMFISAWIRLSQNTATKVLLGRIFPCCGTEVPDC